MNFRHGSQVPIPAVYMRGGSSKAVFFHEKDLPPPGRIRDAILKRVMGSPDALQIDGMGGSRAITSKIAIVRPSIHPNADVDYTFVQVGVKGDFIDYTGNCGNISSAVGVFAIQEGLISTSRVIFNGNNHNRCREVRIHVTGTKDLLISHVPIDGSGIPLDVGNFKIAAVPGSGAPILMDYRHARGGSLHRGMLPTTKVIDIVEVAGTPVKITICDVANLIVFAHAHDFDLDLSTDDNRTVASSSVLTANMRLLSGIKELRGRVALMLGMCSEWQRVDQESPFLPMVVLVDSAPVSESAHIGARLFLDNMCHESMAGTGAVCLTAASCIPGSVVHAVTTDTGAAQLEDLSFHISHPRGIIAVALGIESGSRTGENVKFRTLSFVRTARRIMDGNVYIP